MSNIIKKLIFFFLYPVKRFITPKNSIIFSTNSPYRYGGGPKYLFEYLSKKNFDCYWWTKNEEIKNFLKNKKLNYFSPLNFINFLKLIFNTKLVIDSGDDHYDFCGLLKKDKRVIKLCVGHGSGPKIINFKKKNEVGKNFDYLSFTSEYSKKKIGIEQLKVDTKKIKIIGNPKNDIFFNKLKVNKIYKEKKISKFLFPQIKKNIKIIFYAPTWRSYKTGLPLKNLSKFNLKKFDIFLKKNNFYFIYNFHINSNFQYLKDLERIKFISTEIYSFYDTNKMMCESDIFCTDCSTLSTEAAILNKPQIIIFPDYNKYCKFHGFIEPFKSNIPGKFVNDLGNLKKYLIKYKSREKYLSEYNIKIKNYLNKYYDKKITNSLVLHKKLINNILSS